MKVCLCCFFILSFSYSTSSAQFLGIGKHKNKAPEGVYDTHVVSQGETLFSISKKYHTTADTLRMINPEIKRNDIAIGQTLKVPQVPKSVLKKEAAHDQLMQQAILYTVRKKETLYSIARENNTDVASLMKWNEMKDPNVKKGQQIIVGFKKMEDKNAVQPGTAAVSNKNDEVTSDKKNITQDLGTTAAMIDEKGAAIWIKDVDDNGDMYALHPTAPIGTEITVKNLMNNKTVNVKVVGKLPDTPDNQNIVIKLSSSAAKQLGALDEKFVVELNYPGTKH